jgi:hypothetical protein
MSYNTDHLRTAGKITVYTTFLGVLVFACVFIFNLGETQIKHANAQSSATTSVTVLNTPPAWTASSTEVTESSTTTPTNVGSVVSWTAVGTDSNSEDYWLLICDTNATPTPNSGGAPTCTSGVQWARSATTTSGTPATAATTTLASWVEVNNWYAWICDGNSGTPRCNNTYSQGTNATNSSPFEVNHRPSFSIYNDNSPTAPGAVVTFTSTSSDADVSGVADTVKLIVCATQGFNTATDSCTGTTLGSTTVLVSADATATYTVIIPTQDQNYGAYGYVIDNHGFESAGVAHDTDTILTVSNVAPTVSGAGISLVQATTTDIVLTTESGETTGFTLSFTVADNNSCDAAGGGNADEVTGYDLSIYRSGIGSTTCAVTGPYNANYCYPSSVAPTAWNLSCTASSTTCTPGGADTDILYECTFPLWYIADPTGSAQTQYPTEDWRAQVRGIDDDAATGALTESTSNVNVDPLLAFTLNTLTIAYGALEPGQKNETLTATTTVAATGNIGVDTNLEGESMCSTYTGATPCAPSDSSTIPEDEQVFATSSVAYAQGFPLSSTTPYLLDLNVNKTTSTSTPATKNAFWGINVPASITYAGSYTGQNTFTAVASDPSQW